MVLVCSIVLTQSLRQAFYTETEKVKAIKVPWEAAGASVVRLRVHNTCLHAGDKSRLIKQGLVPMHFK